MAGEGEQRVGEVARRQAGDAAEEDGEDHHHHQRLEDGPGGPERRLGLVR